MDVLEHTLDITLDEFLERRLMAHLSTSSPDGPKHSPLWFLWEDDRLWFVASRQKRTFPDRIERDPACAVGIVDFDPETGRLHHVGFRGWATVKSLQPDRADRILKRYFRAEKEAWNQDRFGDPQEWGEEMVLIEFVPETVVARDQSYDVPHNE